jgi:hypothetical protein
MARGWHPRVRTPLSALGMSSGIYAIDQRLPSIYQRSTRSINRSALVNWTAFHPASKAPWMFYKRSSVKKIPSGGLPANWVLIR